MLTVEKKEAPKSQRHSGKGTNFTFRVDGATVLEVKKWFFFHVSKWPTDLLVGEAANFKRQTERIIARRYHRLNIAEITYDPTDLRGPFFQLVSRFNLSDVIPGLLAQSCMVKPLPLEEIKKELKAKYATYPDPTFFSKYG